MIIKTWYYMLRVATWHAGAPGLQRARRQSKLLGNEMRMRLISSWRSDVNR